MVVAATYVQLTQQCMGGLVGALLSPSERVRPLRVVSTASASDGGGGRFVASVRSDVLAELPLRNWYRNRAPEEERVAAIAGSILLEGEVDHRLYLARIADKGGRRDELHVYDGNHRREALMQLYQRTGRVFWVEVDVLVCASDREVVRAFRRINSGVCVPDAYLALAEDDVAACTQTAAHERAATMVQRIRALWPEAVVVDRARTQAPRVSKNALFDAFVAHASLRPATEDERAIQALVELEYRHRGAAATLLRPTTAKIASNIHCFAFACGMDAVERALRQLDTMVVVSSSSAV